MLKKKNHLELSFSTHFGYKVPRNREDKPDVLKQCKYVAVGSTQGQRTECLNSELLFIVKKTPQNSLVLIKLSFLWYVLRMVTAELGAEFGLVPLFVRWTAGSNASSVLEVVRA